VNRLREIRPTLHAHLHFTRRTALGSPGDDAESERCGRPVAEALLISTAVHRKDLPANDRRNGPANCRVLQALDANGLTEKHHHHFSPSDNGGSALQTTWPFTGKKRNCWKGFADSGLDLRPARIPKAGQPTGLHSMDWMPTLLAAAGIEPHPSYPVDGHESLADPDSECASGPRKLFWRYKRMPTSGARWRLPIPQDPRQYFPLNVVEDPLKRAT